jgi:Flp pilus assembly pilin Flp
MKQQVIDRKDDSGAANLIEYVMISGILMVLMVVMMLMVNSTIMEGPVNTVSYAAFTDIGNGVSTRIVDVYIIAPYNGSISTMFDLPDDVAGRDYFVEIGQYASSQDVTVSRGYVYSKVMLAGIGATRNATGNTTGRGINRISYDSRGF